MPTIHRQKVVAGAVTFNDPGTILSGATSMGVDVCEGWKSSPEPDVISTDLGVLRNGVELGTVFPMRQRFITIGGWALGVDEAAAEELHDALVRDAFPLNTDLKMVRHEATPKYVWYRRSASFATDWQAVPNGFRWDTTLICKDPRKYSVSQQVESAGTAGLSETGMDFPVTFPFSFDLLASGAALTTVGIFNEGNTPSPSLSAEITGPLTAGNWRLRNDTTDSEISFEVGISTGDTLTLDFRTKTVWLNGFAYNGRKEGEWWELAPGSNSIRLYANFDAATTVTITAESAWE